VKVATWNVNSIKVRLEHVLTWLDRELPDVLALQEIKTKDEDFPADALRAHLRQILPPYLIPAVFVSLAAIPQTPSGKVDRQALQRRALPTGDAPRHAPRTPAERQLVEIWAEVLQRPAATIGIDDDFFDLGGHSLLAVRLLARTSEGFGRRLPLAALFGAPTVRAFAERLADTDTATPAVLVPIQSGDAAGALFAVPGAGGNVLSLRALARAFGPQQALYGLQSLGLDGAAPAASVEQAAAANIAAMRERQPRGPYRLIGHSYGGTVAFEMARQLQAQGDDVAALILLDAQAPGRERAAPDPDGELAEWLLGQAAAEGLTVNADRDALRGLAGADPGAVLQAHGIALDRAQFDTLYGVFRANLDNFARYRPQRLQRPLRACLVRATQGTAAATADATDYGWSAWLAPPPRVLDIDADHFSLLDGAAAQRLADALRDSGALPPDAAADVRHAATRRPPPTTTATIADQRGTT